MSKSTRLLRASLFSSAVALQVAATAHSSLTQSSQETLSAATARLSARFNVVVVVETAIGHLPVAARGKSADTIDAALDSLTAGNRSIRWRRAALPAADRNSDPDRMSAAVRALEVMGGGALATEARGDFSMVRRAAGGLDPGERTAYVVFDGTQPSDGMTPEERFVATQRQLSELMAEVPPASRPNAMAGWVRVLQGQDKDTIERTMTPMLTAGMRAWERTSPEQRTTMMNVSMGLLNRPIEPRTGPDQRSESAARGFRSLLTTAAKNLGKSTSCTILFEPDLAVTRKPPSELGEGPIDSRLDRLVGPLAGIAWCRVYLPGNVEFTRGFLAKIAADVRRLEALGALTVHLPGTETKPPVTLATWKRGDRNGERMEDARLNSTPVYLLYSRNGIDSRPAGDRMADLLNRQMGMLMRMDSDQLSGAMESAMSLYQGNGAPPEDVMSLPIMTGMMAVWFPRAAKESKGQP